MILESRQSEVILKKGKHKFEGMTTAKNMRGWILGRISKYGKGKTPQDMEYRMIFEGILNAYNHFHIESNLEIPLEQWKGKSSFQIIDQLDKITIIKYQKANKNEEPEKKEIQINKENIKILLNCIIKLSEDYRRIPTKILSILYSRKLGLNHSGWKTGEHPIFSDRNFHNEYTLILGALDKLKIISYSGGLTTYLNNPVSFQEALDNFL